MVARLVDDSICRLTGLLLSLYKSISCLFSYKDRAFSATSATLEGKKEMVARLVDNISKIQLTFNTSKDTVAWNR